MNFNKKDYDDFLTNEDGESSPIVFKRLNQIITRQLTPTHQMIFFKLTTTHIFASLLTLSICPQFGLRMFGSGPGVMEYFMYFGNNVCSLLCGTFFLGTSIVAFKFIASRPAWNLFKRYYLGYSTTLATISLAGLIIFDASILNFITLIFWLIGAVFVTFATMTTLTNLKRMSVLGIK